MMDGMMEESDGDGDDDDDDGSGREGEEFGEGLWKVR
jgi:hypothetical protein